MAVAHQKAAAYRMESAQYEIAGDMEPEESFNSLFHFLGRLDGEGANNDIAWSEAIGYQIGHACRQRLGLSGTRGCQHLQDRGRAGYGGLLCIVEAAQDVVHGESALGRRDGILRRVVIRSAYKSNCLCLDDAAAKDFIREAVARSRAVHYDIPASPTRRT